MSVTEMVGWDLLYRLIERDLKTETDIIVAITHWYLIKEAGFRCLGTGDEVSMFQLSYYCRFHIYFTSLPIAHTL